MPLSPIRLAALAILAALVVPACTRTGDTDPSAPELRVYEVPPARTEALGMALNDVFMAGENDAPVGKASQRIPGQLLVLAPAAMHASIGDTLDQLATGTGKDSATAGNVQLNFWLIDAVPGAPSENASSLPQPVAESLRRQFPDLAFSLYDQARLGIQGLHGDAYLDTSAGTGIRAEVAQQEDGLVAEFEIVAAKEADASVLQTTVALPMDKYIGLAVTGAPGDGATDAQRIVVVQATSG